MWYKKFEDENGFYQDENGTRYMVAECHRVMAPDGRKNAELGYTEFENMDECLSTWGLSQVPESDYETKTKSIPETDVPTTFSLKQSDILTAFRLRQSNVPTTFSLKQSVEPISKTKSTLTIKDINKLSSTELLKKYNIKSFADVRNKLLAKFKKS